MIARTVLIAEDIAEVRERFGAALVEVGHRTIPASSAAELFESLRRQPQSTDLILLDLHLSGTPGVDLVRTVRSADARVPIVVFSGTIADAAEARALDGLSIAGFVNEYCSPAAILPVLAPFLFPDNFNRRSTPRILLATPVSYRVGQQIVSGLTSNIGKGGLAVRTMTPLDVGTNVHVRFRLPGITRELGAEARVAWSHSNLGMGLQFESVSAEDQTTLDDYVDTHFFPNRRT